MAVIEQNKLRGDDVSLSSGKFQPNIVMHVAVIKCEGHIDVKL